MACVGMLYGLKQPLKKNHIKCMFGIITEAWVVGDLRVAKIIQIS